jgi:glyoxylase-like metal-dependent hydrolase (beta-lactamase superfamily II)
MTPPSPPPVPARTAAHGWREVADRVFQRRYEPYDVTVAVVVGADGLAVVDTRGSLGEGRELREHLRQLSAAPVRWVVNTHWHFDHLWGNAVFTAPRQRPPAEVWGHRSVPGALAGPLNEEQKREFAAEGGRWASVLAELEEAAPDRLVDRVHTLDLGDRAVRLHHPGRGHTDGDLLVHVPDADALIAGDLVEQSGPPAYGPDSYPLDWAPTLDALLAGTTSATVVVPGHGDPVDAAFVRAQRADVAAVAEQLTALHRSGVPVEEAMAEGTWPYPAAALGSAAARAYAQLDRTIG